MARASKAVSTSNSFAASHRVYRRPLRAARGPTRAEASKKSMIFDAGVRIQDLPWGAEGSGEVKSRTLSYRDGDVTLEAYMAWDPAKVAAEGPRPGILVAHTAIGPQEVFVQSAVEALAKLGYTAMALDLFGTGQCVFDKEVRNGILQPLREDRRRLAKRMQAAYDALVSEGTVVKETSGVAAVGFCLGGQAVLDLARANTAKELRGVVSFHGVLDHPSVFTKSDEREPPNALILHGEDDPFTPDEKLKECLDGLTSLGVTWDLQIYSGAKHAFTRPEKVTDDDFNAGFQYDARSARRSWSACKTFIESLVG